jgi:hypothetical protein
MSREGAEALSILDTQKSATQTRCTYDHPIREQAVRTSTLFLPKYVTIPRATVSTWRRCGSRPVATIEPVEPYLHPPKPTFGVRVSQPKNSCPSIPRSSITQGRDDQYQHLLRPFLALLLRVTENYFPSLLVVRD